MSAQLITHASHYVNKEPGCFNDWPQLDESAHQHCQRARTRYEHWSKRKSDFFDALHTLWEDNYFHSIDEEEYEANYPRLARLWERAERNRLAAFDELVAALKAAEDV